MKIFLKKISLYIFPIIIGLSFLDVFLSYNLKKSHNFQGEIEVWEAIYNGEIDTDIAIYGNSRAWTQIDPKILATKLNKKVYNFGIDGHNFWLQYLRHTEYLANNKKPNIIIINVDDFSLEKRQNLYQLEQFLPYALWNFNIKKYTQSYRGFSNIDYYVPFFRYAAKTRVLKDIWFNFRNKNSTNLRTRGFKSYDLKWGEKESIIKRKEKYNVNLDTQSIQLFDRFIQECKALNITLIFVYTPIQIHGAKNLYSKINIINMYSDFAKKYNLNFLDYSKDSLRFDKKYFYNAMHLNKKGSCILSQKIANDVKTLLNSSTNTQKNNEKTY